MKVRHFEARRFFVESSTGGEHLVDLEENDGRGKCGCEDHQFRVQPELDKSPSVLMSCKHVRAAWCFDKLRMENEAAITTK